MYKLASCCLLLIGCLSPLFSLPVLDSREQPLQLSDPSMNVFNTRGSMRKAFSGQDPDILLRRILARMRKHKKRSSPSECFWKYCV